MIIPEYLKDELEGKKYKPKGAARIIDLGVKGAWEVPGLLLDMFNRDRGKGLKGGLAPRLSHVRKQDTAIRAAGEKGIGGTEVTRPHNYFAPSRKDILEAERKADLLAPNTNEKATSSNQYALKEGPLGKWGPKVDSSGNLIGSKGEYLPISKADLEKAKEQPTVLDEDTTSKVAKIPEESNFVKWGRKHSPSKGSVAKNKALLADMRAEQASSAVDDKGDPLPTNKVKVKPLSKAEFDKAGYNLTDRQVDYQAAGIKLPEGVKPGTALEWNTDQSLTASPTISNIQSLPKAEQLTKLKAFDGTNAGLIQGLKGVGTIASALQAVFNKKKKPSTAGMEDKGRGIEQVLVASGNNNTEDFYDSLFG